MTPEELPAMWVAIGDLAEAAAAPAVNAMCEAETRYLKEDLLIRYEHAPETKTPSPPGEPPARVSGALVDSVTPVYSAGAVAGAASASVSPHTVYDWVQEYGATIHAKPRPSRSGKRPHTMHFVLDGEHHFPLVVTLPARPYMHRAAEDLSASGEFTRRAAEAFEQAVWG